MASEMKGVNVARTPGVHALHKAACQSTVSSRKKQNSVVAFKRIARPASLGYAFELLSRKCFLCIFVARNFWP